MVVLVIGGGGREHTLTWACAASSAKVIVAPGNGGTVGSVGACAVESSTATSLPDIVALAKSSGAELVVVGPEAPLADGLADALLAAGVPCFGPVQAAARLESSKAFSKDFMARHKIPTAKYGIFTKFSDAETYIRDSAGRVVVKASGLAAGKGVFVPETSDEAVAAARSVLEERIFGDAGSEVVIEEFVEGVEVSVLAFTDGTTVVPMPGAQDHKRIFEFDQGSNTGGMGAFAPSPVLDAALMQAVTAAALQPVVDGMRAEGSPYVGVLYAGLMVRPDRSFIVLEYNCRLGDPETQVLLPLLETPFLDVVRACTSGTLASLPVKFKKNVTAATVVAVAGGYPGSYEKGKEIKFGSKASSCSISHSDRSGSIVFHAGTKRDGSGKVVTNGGRVLAVTSLAPSLSAAVRASYSVLEDISFDGMYYRRDIGGPYVRPRAAAQPLRIGVLGSTRGSNLIPILAAIDSGELRGAEIKVVVSNKSDAGILEKGKAANIPSFFVESAGKSREAFDTEVASILHTHEVDLVLLVGFMRILSKEFVSRYAWRVLNVHPSLLPDFGGMMDLQVHEAVIKAGKKETGCTVHFVDAGVDTGAVVWQSACAVAGDDTPVSLKAKVQQLEGQALINSIKLFLDDADADLLTALRKAGGKWPSIAHLLPKSRIPVPGSTLAAPGGKLTYAQAGVDIDAGDALVENLKPLAKSTARPGADADLGGFGGLFDLKSAGFKDPLLVSGTDGVGTKLRVAQEAGIHDTVGIDLVAMSVNDIVVQGAEPLLFLDYFATGHLDVQEATDVIKGIADGCRQAGCALIGGETAEMPSMYAPGDYDLAGFAVGAVERDRVLPDIDGMKDGDVILGIASSGVHSNGFSLVRRVVAQYGFDWQGPPPFKSSKARLCEAVLEPTRIYVKCLMPSLKDPRTGRIKAMAHITGGGLPDNVPRVLRPGMQAVIDCKSWDIPPVFRWMQSHGTGIEPAEMARTFNIGIGMIVVCSKESAEEVKAEIAAAGEAVFTIGVMKDCALDAKQVVLNNLVEAFTQ